MTPVAHRRRRRTYPARHGYVPNPHAGTWDTALVIRVRTSTTENTSTGARP